MSNKQTNAPKKSIQIYQLSSFLLFTVFMYGNANQSINHQSTCATFSFNPWSRKFTKSYTFSYITLQICVTSVVKLFCLSMYICMKNQTIGFLLITKHNPFLLPSPPITVKCELFSVIIEYYQSTVSPPYMLYMYM